jgi:hypothetical protein
MSLADISDGLVKTIKLPGLKVFGIRNLPDKLSPPALVILLGESEYHRTYGDNPYELDGILRLILLLGDQDTPSAANRILDYIEPGGKLSLTRAIEEDPTLAGSCSGAILTRNLGLGVTSWGGVPYLSTEFELEIYT